MRAAKEALLLLLLLCAIIYPLTPGGRYTLWNLSGYSQKKGIEKYFSDRGIVATDVVRRSLGVSNNNMATFKTDFTALKKITDAKDSKLISAEPSAVDIKGCRQFVADHPTHKLTSYVRLLRLPPLLEDSEKEMLANAYLLDDLRFFTENPATLPPELKWTEVRLCVRRQSGQAWIFYGSK